MRKVQKECEGLLEERSGGRVMTIEEIAWCIICGLCFFVGWMTGKGYLFTLKREELAELLKELKERREKDDESRSGGKP